MKKTASFIMAFLLLLLFSACGFQIPSIFRSSDPSESDPPEATPTATQPVNTEGSVNTERPATSGEDAAAQMAGTPRVTDPPKVTEPPLIGDYQTVQGCSFYIPEGFVLEKSNRVPTGLGYEYSFYHAGLDMSIYLYEFYTEGYGISGTEWMERDYARYAADDTVVYFPRRDNWFVASGYSKDGTQVYYTRVYGTEVFYYFYSIGYPTANKSVCDQMVGDFANSFHLW